MWWVEEGYLTDLSSVLLVSPLQPWAHVTGLDALQHSIRSVRLQAACCCSRADLDAAKLQSHAWTRSNCLCWHLHRAHRARQPIGLLVWGCKS